MVITADWARARGYSGEPDQPTIDGLHHVFPRIACEVALRAVVLEGMIAVSVEFDAERIIKWFNDQQIWDAVSPREQGFLLNDLRSVQDRFNFFWRIEAQWALLWMIRKIETLGLPTQVRDDSGLVDEIIPAIGADVHEFITSAQLRDADVIIAEDLRAYDLWCDACAVRRKKESLPVDLNWDVLYERRYAFEWLDGLDEWDQVTCDA